MSKDKTTDQEIADRAIAGANKTLKSHGLQVRRALPVDTIADQRRALIVQVELLRMQLTTEVNEAETQKGLIARLNEAAETCAEIQAAIAGAMASAAGVGKDW
jgi:hypothetical protein